MWSQTSHRPPPEESSWSVPTWTEPQFAKNKQEVKFKKTNPVVHGVREASLRLSCCPLVSGAAAQLASACYYQSQQANPDSGRDPLRMSAQMSIWQRRAQVRAAQSFAESGSAWFVDLSSKRRSLTRFSVVFKKLMTTWSSKSVWNSAEKRELWLKNETLNQKTYISQLNLIHNLRTEFSLIKKTKKWSHSF